jgi:hypothetical protein
MKWDAANQIRPTLERKSDGKLWAFTSVGSYPIVYVTADGGHLCPACANGENGSEASETHEDKQWRLTMAGVHWEGAPLECAHCNADIESAYGDPNDEASDET